MSRYLLVGNPSSRSGKGLDRIDDTLREMRDLGMDVDFLPTVPAGGTPALVASAIDGGDCEVVVYVGGDGTFAEVAKGVIGASRPVAMGMMPAGTANDQGQSFGIGARPQDVSENLAILRANHRIRMDVGRIARFAEDGAVTHTDFWFDNLGFGMAPAILARRNRDREVVGQIPILREIYRDQAVYAGAVVTELVRSQLEPVKFAAEILTPDRSGPLRFEGLTDIMVNNTAVFGGEWVPVRDASATDGQLDLVLLQGQFEMLAKLVLDHKLLSAWIDDAEALGLPITGALRAPSFDIELLQPRGGEVPCQIDGEEWHAGTRFRVDVLPGRLPLIVRAGFVPPWAS
jgi:diacylglycerol kinase family enzyme